MSEAAVKTFKSSGIFGVELFLSADGNVVINEIAPRPHNSGHYTMDACVTSQFENHIRAVAGMPLGCCDMKVGASIMLNIIGESDDMDLTWEPFKRAMTWYVQYLYVHHVYMHI